MGTAQFLLVLAQVASVPPPAPSEPEPETEQATPPEVDPGILEGRRRPGFQTGLPDRVEQDNPGAVRAPPPDAFPADQFPVPDRWRIMTGLCPARGADQTLAELYPNLRQVCHSKRNPFHQNLLKGDLPLAAGKRPGFLKGDDWFLSLNAISDTVLEPRTFPIPVGVQTTERPGSLNVFGKDASYVFSQTFIVGAALTKGNTAFARDRIPDRAGGKLFLCRCTRTARAQCRAIETQSPLRSIRWRSGTVRRLPSAQRLRAIRFRFGAGRDSTVPDRFSRLSV
jgi:hypothetical protein